MPYTPTVKYGDLQEGDILLYRGDSFFSTLIKCVEVIKYGSWRHFFIAFTHIATVIYNRDTERLQRFDAMEGKKTNFRPTIGKAYVFRWKTPLTARQLMTAREYALKRKGSFYDIEGAVSSATKKERDNIFGDFCSELWKNMYVACGKIRDMKAPRPYQLYRKYRKQWDFIGVMI